MLHVVADCLAWQLMLYILRSPHSVCVCVCVFVCVYVCVLRATAGCLAAQFELVCVYYMPCLVVLHLPSLVIV